MNRKLLESICMDDDEFYKEHRRLGKILKSGDKQKRMAELKRQSKEVEEYRSKKRRK